MTPKTYAEQIESGVFITRGGWWPCEVQVLVSMAQENLHYRDIAEVLQRDPQCVCVKIHQMRKKGLLERKQ